MKSIIGICIAIWLLPATLAGQAYERVSEIAVAQDGRTLLSPWAGGLNAPHFAEADFNNDGITDLFVYDKDGKRRYTFIHIGGGRYIYEPVYALNFPEINAWFLLEDYNCDGIADLITHGSRGAPQTYKGYYDEGILKFEYERPIVYYLSSSGFLLNLYTTTTHRPLMKDINGDGDIDVLAFDFNLIRLDYYENQRVERGLSCDSLLFKRADRCWGNFRETGLSLTVELGDTCDFKFSRTMEEEGSGRILHPGGSAIDLYDEDGDGVYDLLLGDATFERINYLKNNGSRTVANLYAQNDSFPNYDVQVDVAIFPAPYVLDVDQDGDEDILVAPFNPGAIENYQNVWYYENDGSGASPFTLRQKDFLVGEMIDVGELAAPAFFDYNGDGLLDLVIGNGGYYEGGGDYIFSLTLYENTGSQEVPAYELIDRNYLNLNALDLDDLRPCFGDLDNDGDADLLVGEKGGKILIMDNVNGNFQNARLLTDASGTAIDIGQSSHPALFDFDGNGTLDLMIGTRDGNLVYYQNTGTPQAPAFTFRTDTMGSVLSHPANSTLRYSSPLFGDFNGDGEADLILGGADSRLKFYASVGTDANAPFAVTSDNFLDEPFFNFQAIDIRPRIVPSAADISNDGLPELVLGISNGGLELYSQELSDTTILSVGEQFVSGQLKVYPNPVGSFLTVEWGTAFSQNLPIALQISDLLGRVCHSTVLTGEAHFRWSAAELPRGIYHISMQQGPRIGSIRFVKP